MLPGGVTEIVSHFIGYLHISLETERAWSLLDDAGARRITIQEDASASGHARPAPLLDDDPLFSARVRAYEPGQSPDLGSAHAAKAFAPLKPHLDAAKLPVAHSAHPAQPADLGVSGGGGGSFVTTQKLATVTYSDTLGSQVVAHVEQVNAAADSDQLLARIDADPQLQQGTGEALADAISSAKAAAGAGLDLHELPIQDQIATLTQQSEAMASAQEPLPDDFKTGQFKNGVYSETDGTPDEIKVPDLPHEGTAPGIGDVAPGQTTDLGHNVSANVGAIVDAGQAHSACIIVGDVYQTNAIVQVNVLCDVDQIVTNGTTDSSGGGIPVALSTGGNTVDNIANVLQTAYEAEVPKDAFPGYSVHVDICSGDYLNVSSLYQQNFLIDNDTSVHLETANDYSAILGQDGQINAATLGNFGLNYDLIIVQGSFYSANLIYQVNVVLDSDIVKLLLDPSNTDPGSQAIASGGNTLVNDASIETVGNGDFKPMSDNASALAQQIASHATSFDPSLLEGLPGDGSGTLKVLYITGDYYDLNVITQQNIICDADTALQMLPASVVPLPVTINGLDDPSATGTAGQTTTTGGNLASNQAAIVNVGTLSDYQYVGGQHYESSTLIQANLVTEDAQVTHPSYDALAPEIIAFIEHGDAPPTDPLTSVPLAAPPMASGDVMGGILH